MRGFIILAMIVLILVGCSKRDDTTPNADSSSVAINSDTPLKMEGHSDSISSHMMSGDMQKDMSMMNDMMIRELGQGDSLYDHRFIDMMIVHHEGAILMAQDALLKANRPELKKLAQSIITGQQKEIDKMKQWRTMWYTTNTSSDMENSEDELKNMLAMNTMMVQNLGAKDSGYEERFINIMIPHHNGAVALAVDALEKASHQEIKSMAQGIIDAQKTEIEQMEGWRKQWYGH